MIGEYEGTWIHKETFEVCEKMNPSPEFSRMVLTTSKRNRMASRLKKQKALASSSDQAKMDALRKEIGDVNNDIEDIEKKLKALS